MDWDGPSFTTAQTTVCLATTASQQQLEWSNQARADGLVSVSLHAVQPLPPSQPPLVAFWLDRKGWVYGRYTGRPQQVPYAGAWSAASSSDLARLMKQRVPRKPWRNHPLTAALPNPRKPQERAPAVPPSSFDQSWFEVGCSISRQTSCKAFLPSC
jgi:hypothetical protein